MVAVVVEGSFFVEVGVSLAVGCRPFGGLGCARELFLGGRG